MKLSSCWWAAFAAAIIIVLMVNQVDGQGRTEASKRTGASSAPGGSDDPPEKRNPDKKKPSSKSSNSKKSKKHKKRDPYRKKMKYTDLDQIPSTDDSEEYLPPPTRKPSQRSTQAKKRSDTPEAGADNLAPPPPPLASNIPPSSPSHSRHSDQSRRSDREERPGKRERSSSSSSSINKFQPAGGGGGSSPRTSDREMDLNQPGSSHSRHSGQIKSASPGGKRPSSSSSSSLSSSQGAARAGGGSGKSFDHKMDPNDLGPSKHSESSSGSELKGLSFSSESHGVDSESEAQLAIEVLDFNETEIQQILPLKDGEAGKEPEAYWPLGTYWTQDAVKKLTQNGGILSSPLAFKTWYEDLHGGETRVPLQHYRSTQRDTESSIKGFMTLSPEG